MDKVITVVVIALLAPGLLMVAAVVVRLLLRGFRGGADPVQRPHGEGRPPPEDDQTGPNSRSA